MARIQLELAHDYRTNVPSYPAWQRWLREAQPPLLVVWGRHDPLFTEAGAWACRREVPSAEVRLLDAGHFALVQVRQTPPSRPRNSFARPR